MESLDPNRSACTSEASLLHDMLRFDEQDRPRLRARTESAQLAFARAKAALRDAHAVFATASTFLDDARARELVLNDSIRTTRRLLHLVRKIPADILSMIFSLVVEDNSSEFPIEEVAQRRVVDFFTVYRRWRKTALSCPRLWRFIFFCEDEVWSEVTVAAVARITVNLQRVVIAYPNGARLTLAGVRIRSDTVLPSLQQAQTFKLCLDECYLDNDRLSDTATTATFFPALRRLLIDACHLELGFTANPLLAFLRERYRPQRVHSQTTTGSPSLERLHVSFEISSEDEGGDLVADGDEQYAAIVQSSEWYDSSDEGVFDSD